MTCLVPVWGKDQGPRGGTSTFAIAESLNIGFTSQALSVQHCAPVGPAALMGDTLIMMALPVGLRVQGGR
jgi:hypothetical protein